MQKFCDRCFDFVFSARFFGFVTGIAFAFSMVAHGQTLTTAETIGKGKVVYFAASNALVAKDFTTLHYGYGQIVYGVSRRIDLYAGPGIVTAFGRSHANATAGANVNLWNRGVAVSSFNLFTTGIAHRSEAANLLWFNSTIASKNFKIGEKTLTGYSGYSFLAPFGPEKETKLFTPPELTKTVPFGIVVPLKKTAVFFEYNYGRKLQSASIGLAFTP